eukprot:scaffold4545_cov103-Alexandrium_tamarense.AAC.4
MNSRDCSTHMVAAERGGIGVLLNDEDTSIHSTPEPKRLLLVAYVDCGLVAYHALRYGWGDCQQSPAQANI